MIIVTTTYGDTVHIDYVSSDKEAFSLRLEAIISEASSFKVEKIR